MDTDVFHAGVSKYSPWERSHGLLIFFLRRTVMAVPAKRVQFKTTDTNVGVVNQYQDGS